MIAAMSGGREEGRAVTSWRDLVALHARVSEALERALGDEHRISVSEFEVLDRLAASPHRKRRIQELADETHLSQSALSRLVGRLEADGLATRAVCDHDRRGTWACLTDAGAERHQQAAPTYREVLARTLEPVAPGR
jgi:DNA-binding MarR family transcriptional regulator